MQLTKSRENNWLLKSQKKDDEDEASEGEVSDASEYSLYSGSSTERQEGRLVELPSEKEISLFIKKRKQRTTQKYILNDEGRNYLAQVFFEKLVRREL